MTQSDRRLCAVTNCSGYVWSNERNREKESHGGVSYYVFYYCKEHSCRARNCQNKTETKRYCDEHYRAMNRRKRAQYQIRKEVEAKQRRLREEQQRLRDEQRQRKEAEVKQQRLREEQQGLRDEQRKEEDAKQQKLREERQKEADTVHALQHLIELDEEVKISRRTYCEHCGQCLHFNEN